MSGTSQESWVVQGRAVDKLKAQLDRWFKITAQGSSIRTEMVAGFTTFLTMSYVIFVNPEMLAAAGLDKGAVFVATCLMAALATIAMGLWANYPIALAPGMGLNAFFAFGVCLGMGYPWEVAMGAVFWGGIAFLILSLFKVREWIINSIPLSLRIGITAGIGLFIALIGLKSSGIIVPNEATIVTLGDLTSASASLAALGFVIILALAHRGVQACVLVAIVVVTLIALTTGQVEYQGLVAMPPSIEPIFGKLDIWGALTPDMFGIIFAFFFVNLFDTTGTLIAVCDKAKLLDENGKMPRMARALEVDSVASSLGAVCGVTTVTSYIESASGVAVGGRTGFSALVTAGLFLLALFLSPIVHMVPAYATTGALIYVAVLMASGLAHVDWNDLTEAGPVLVTTIMMPLSFSIANGIALGFITYAVVKLLTGRYKEISPSIWVLATLFILKFVFFGM